MVIVARRPLDSNLNAGFAQRNLGILRYSRRHVIGDFRRPASAQPTTAKRGALQQTRRTLLLLLLLLLLSISGLDGRTDRRTLDRFTCYTNGDTRQ